jgi:hypothetical protein
MADGGGIKIHRVRLSEERRAFTQKMPTPVSKERGPERRGRGARRRRDRRLQRAPFGEEHEAAPAKASQHC